MQFLPVELNGMNGQVEGHLSVKQASKDIPGSNPGRATLNGVCVVTAA